MNAHRTRAASRIVRSRTERATRLRHAPKKPGTYDVTRRRSQAVRLRGAALAVVKMFGAAFREEVRAQRGRR